jgi:hypothetical protein
MHHSIALANPLAPLLVDAEADRDAFPLTP